MVNVILVVHMTNATTPKTVFTLDSATIEFK